MFLKYVIAFVVGLLIAGPYLGAAFAILLAVVSGTSAANSIKKK